MRVGWRRGFGVGETAAQPTVNQQKIELLVGRRQPGMRQRHGEMPTGQAMRREAHRHTVALNGPEVRLAGNAVAGALLIRRALSLVALRQRHRGQVTRWTARKAPGKQNDLHATGFIFLQDTGAV